MPSRVSVVVPVYQGAGTLGPCLDALTVALRALGESAELVVVDDGSSDGSGELAAARGARVVRHPVNRGTSAARNTGWRAGTGQIVVYVDADVEVHPDALVRLVSLLDAEPALQGANGVLSLAPLPEVASDFANLSIHFQHRAHGARVASSFTSLCALRRSTLEAMGGWGEEWSGRFADDVQTRFRLPEGAIGVDFDACGDHAKRVTFRGLMKHRVGIGWFFVQSILAHRAEVAARPRTTVLAARYPLNTALAGLSVAGLALVPLHAPTGVATLALAGAGFVAVNIPFTAFAIRNRGIPTGTIYFLVTVAESYGMLWGIVSGTASALRAPPRILRPTR